MTHSAERQACTIELEREEQWLVHRVILDRIELEVRSPAEAEPPSLAVYRVFEKLESGTYCFTRRERRCIERELNEYLDEDEGVQHPERRLVERVLDEIRRRDPNGGSIESVP